MPRILVIDDEPDIRLALAITLEDHGYEVVEGSDGAQALELTIATAPDLVILDLNMPNVDGMSALAALKADERTAGVPVCILTAVSDSALERRAEELGAADSIGKPWTEERLMSRVAELTGRTSAGGPARSDACTLHDANPASPAGFTMDRRERLSELVQTRHRAWMPFD